MASLSEMSIVVCPFSGFRYYIIGNEKCPHCGRPHSPFYEIRKKGIDWYKKKDQWIGFYSEVYGKWLATVPEN